VEASRDDVVLDASAVLALLLDEPGADDVENLLRTATARMSTVNVAEVVDVLVRVYGAGPDEAVTSVDELVASAVEAVAPSIDDAARAGQLRARVFDRRTSRVSLADCFVLAIAGPSARIVTGDSTLTALARAEGVQVIRLSR
jgi:ribonuclease VapC